MQSLAASLIVRKASYVICSEVFQVVAIYVLMLDEHGVCLYRLEILFQEFDLALPSDELGRNVAISELSF